MELSSPVSELSLVGPIYQRRLEKLEIRSVGDLLGHVPHRYLDFSQVSDIRRARPGQTLTINGEIKSIKNQYTHSGKKIQIAEISDGTSDILAVWFNQPFLVRVLYPETNVSLAGKIDWFGRKKALISPEYEKVTSGKARIHTGRIIPVYPETAGISSKWLRGRVKEAYEKTQEGLIEFLPEDIRRKYNLVELAAAYRSVHFPKNLVEADMGRERLAFNELLFLHLQNIKRRDSWRKNIPTEKLNADNNSITRFIEALPFKLTGSQKKAIDEILEDLKKDYPMNRLLEGDVGSGKTVVAALTAFVAFINGYQSIMMAPTQILAQQHFDTLNSLLQSFKVRVQLVTSDTKKGGIGRADIFVGTHALIHQNVDFDKVALVVIDEQHRFGVEQRTHLIKKAGKKFKAPHVLTMTATPIPRTVALTLYGDLDLSTLTEVPLGRQKITTWIVPPAKREAACEWINKQITNDKCQVFWVCPLIEESGKETMKDVKAVISEYEKLKKIFNNIGLLHGRMKAKEKNAVVEDFRRGKIDILVATPVVEVGIDIPNATIMVIEAAERFGLATLHQLRGRVGRGKIKSYCLLLTDTRSPRALARLKAMTKSISGFELAELDLKLRGPGEIFGTRQHGFPQLTIASWGDFDLIKKAKSLSYEIADSPEKYPVLQQKINLG